MLTSQDTVHVDEQNNALNPESGTGDLARSMLTGQTTTTRLYDRTMIPFLSTRVFRADKACLPSRLRIGSRGFADRRKRFLLRILVECTRNSAC